MSEQAATLTGAEEVAWDLSDLYAGIDDPAIDTDIKQMHEMAAKLAETYKGRIASLSPAEMKQMLEEYVEILEVVYRLGTYAGVHWSTNTEDAARGKLRQRIDEESSRLQQALVFVDLEWADAPDEYAKSIIEGVPEYQHYLEVARLRRPYLLTEPEEKILAEKDVTGNNAWVRLFSEIHAIARYEWEGEQVPLPVIINKAYYTPDREVRKKATGVVSAKLKEMSHLTTYIYNTLLADKASDDRLRGFKTWVSSRNLSNEVDDESVEALIQAVTSRYDIVARYYKLKAKLLGYDELFDWDRYAPLPTAERAVSWEEAKQTVIRAYGAFHPELAEIVGEFFDSNWIDAPVRPGKQGGAYCSMGTPNSHPYVFLNFMGTPRDVMTLAHELGHGVHGYLAREQNLLQMHTPLTTAETASTFGERLVFDELLAKEPDPAIRLSMLTSKLEDSFATIFRQIAMNRFENAAHTARREQGELTTEQFNEFWLETQRDEFKDSMTLTDDYGYWWSYVPHFMGTPGYVYAYSYGELLVFALYARYREAGPEFAGKYLEMLTNGGSDWPNELAKPLGIDLADPGFWTKGLQIVDDMVKQAEALADEIG